MLYNNCQGPRHNDGPLVAGMSTLVNPGKRTTEKAEATEKVCDEQEQLLHPIVIGFLPFLRY